MTDSWSWIKIGQWYKEKRYNEWFYLVRRYGNNRIDYVVIRDSRVEFWIDAPVSWLFDEDSYVEINSPAEGLLKIRPHEVIMALFNPQNGR
jgi:hypothetical protein